MAAIPIPPTYDRALHESIFYPNLVLEKVELNKQGGKFVHYTSASTAFNILYNSEAWMRNTRVMNDASEIEYGLECLEYALESQAGTELETNLNNIFPNLFDAVKEQFYSEWLDKIRRSTYVTCLSVHDLERENDLGRLSMWRAYGGDNGVALILNSEAMFEDSFYLPIVTSPVGYYTKEGLADMMRITANKVKEHADYVLSDGEDLVYHTLFNSLIFAAICTKHPAFSEEQEWRIIALPEFTPIDNLSESFEHIGGTPQKVVKIPLKNHNQNAGVDVSIRSVIHRVLIGPSEHPAVVRSSIIDALLHQGVEHPEDLIHTTNIPLRAK